MNPKYKGISQKYTWYTNVLKAGNLLYLNPNCARPREKSARINEFRNPKTLAWKKRNILYRKNHG